MLFKNKKLVILSSNVVAEPVSGLLVKPPIVPRRSPGPYRRPDPELGNLAQQTFPGTERPYTQLAEREL